MSAIQDILASKQKPKEKTLLIVQKIREDHTLIHELFSLFATGTDPQKGACADVMKEISKTNPDLLLPYLDTMIHHITYRALHVTWGVQESLGNMAQEYPAETAAALPQLLKNTTHESTVVRWCAAYAITEITLHNTARQPEMIPTITRLSAREKNNGVQQVYLKALKRLGQPVK